MNKPRIAVTMGDPAGIGPEICLDLLAYASKNEIYTPIIFGDTEVLKLCAQKTGKTSDFKTINKENLGSCDTPAVLDFGFMDPGILQPGTANGMTGKATFGYIQEAMDASLAKQVHACHHLPGKQGGTQTSRCTPPPVTPRYLPNIPILKNIVWPSFRMRSVVAL